MVHGICIEAGFSPESADKVAGLIRKEDLRGNSETQVLEDVACLVFLEDQLEGFEREVADEEKVVGIVRKTWRKMSVEGRELALGIPMGERAKEIVKKALDGA